MTHTTSIEVTPSACNTEDLPADTATVNFRTDGAIKKALGGGVADIATQIAQLAITGHAVHQANDGHFLVRRDGMTPYCKDFAELHAFAKQVGAR